MYSGSKTEIYAVNDCLEPNEVSESFIKVESKQSQDFNHLQHSGRQVLQRQWEAQVTAALSSVSSFDPTLRDNCPERQFYSSIKGETKEVVKPPTEMSAAQAINHQSGHLGVDIRPHLFDSVLKQHVLCDSGSQITAWPPDPGDSPLPNTFLKAVNGSKLNCYGYKQVSVKIGRKEYHFQAIKADVQSPILGWDFFKHYRIGFRWNRWGDAVLFDRRADFS